jgi:curved DNA-binding protein CbpA
MTTGGSDDLYALLGVDPGASDEQIRTAFRRLALKWHPDRGGPDVTFIFQRLQAAYAVLSDPAARREYDRHREVGSGRRAPGVMLLRLCASLDALLARGVARHDGDVIELFLEADEVSEGGMIAISMRVPVRGGGDAVYSAWLAVRPGVADGTILVPSASLPDMLRPVRFRVRR